MTCSDILEWHTRETVLIGDRIFAIQDLKRGGLRYRIKSGFKIEILYKVLTLQSNKCYKVPNVTMYQMLQSNKCKMVYKCSMNNFVMFDTM